MSLFKALSRTTDAPSQPYIADCFMDEIEAFGGEPERMKQQVSNLLAYYGEYAAQYMTEVSCTLRDDVEASAVMKFMNSYIAEAVNQAGLHYFEAERGYSIVDKVVQAALDSTGLLDATEVAVFIDELEQTYVVPDVEDEE